MKWFGVRTVYQLDDNAYEERVVLMQADDFDHAIELCESEARSYAKVTECIFLGLLQAYLIGDLEVGDGVEVFSLMRHSQSPPDEYIKRHFDTGAEIAKDSS